MSAGKTPKVLLVIGGGIAAYKSCELVRLIRKGGGDVTCVITNGGQQFVTPMALAALSENPVHTTLWDLKNEAEMGHIQLSREADLVVVCPATADLMAKMAAGIADDLATTLILATDKPVMAVPAMNVRMWQHEATQRNAMWLRQAGVNVVDPDVGAMACGEFGPGRLPEPEMIWLEIASMLGIDPGDVGAAEIAEFVEEADPEPKGGLGGLLSSLIPRSTPKRTEHEIEAQWSEEQVQEQPGEVDESEGPVLATKGSASSAPPTDPEATNHTVKTGAGNAAPEPIEGDAQPVAVGGDPLEGQPDFDEDPEHRPLYGKHVLITAGPTREAIDPVRYIANRSSGKQGFAIAGAAAAAGARVTLVAGPVWLETPPGVDRIDVESARDMADAVKGALPADAAIMVAAVSDWRSKDTSEEKIKKRGSAPPALMLTENPDILANTAAGGKRPRLLIGFAAETENVIENAKAKRKRKGVDWIVANDVSWTDGKSVMGGAENRVHIVTEHDVESLEEMPKADVARELIDRVAQALDDEDDDE
ncbi:phosphopantothenoylcysteine decarboxylase domain-containing protein [Pontixanthobacter aquaemixtae]|uniref:Coenzyme A biosynthesis bifunctional protein CoaBC n=1 Tax=Pontixanthobacter aquaemixtae TaxID=1958940 RepID=A0A844ZTX1_9SPHN|nr:phosphopantothenoylcysteine decarboxylase [Pontixanthobacter aquaemixtae]MXO91751.1 bifunctional phosphopantothenoylcysteine decarboxylase/phosphopantothenate synthase [Pontixanthobacter aquaemixtae]